MAATSGVTIQEWKGKVDSSCLGCGTPSTAVVPLRDPASGDDRDVTPFVGGDFELLTPELPIPTSPRVFIGGGVVATFGFDRTLASEGNPGTIASPLPPQAQDGATYSEDAALGQGSETEAQLDRWIYGARAGLAFPIEVFGRQLRLKPSIGWIQYKVEAKGMVADAECQLVPNPLGPPTNCNVLVPPGALRAIELEATGSDIFNGLGGGMDIEMDTFQFGPIGSSLFIGAHAYKILGEREIEFGNQESFPNTGLPGLGAVDTSAQFNVEMPDFMYRVGLGLRLHWLGFDD